LAENIKQIFYEVYKVAYEWEIRHIITFDPAGYYEDVALKEGHDY
jgi:hypothetical protein